MKAVPPFLGFLGVAVFRIGARFAPSALAPALTPAGGNVAMLLFLVLSLCTVR